jgi:hypothetical protein
MVLLGLVFGAIGLAKANSGRATDRGLAIAGFVCALLGLMICILYAAAFSAALSSTPSAAAPRATAVSVLNAPASSGISTEVQNGAFAFTVP